MLRDARQGSDAAKCAESVSRAERIAFAHLDNALSASSVGPHWLARPEIAARVAELLHDTQGLYTLDAFCLMSNHAHAVLTPDCAPAGDYYPLSKITQSIKGRTALEANRILGRTGRFWQPESYDHVIRNDDELDRVIKYVLWNPVKAGLVADWRDWRWSYARFTPVDL